MKTIKIKKRPRLKSPILVAAWPGMGDVALKAAIYLKDKLAADVASLNSAIKALTTQAAKDIAALSPPVPPAAGTPTGNTGPGVTIVPNSGPSVQVATPIVVEAAPAGVPVSGPAG